MNNLVYASDSPILDTSQDVFNRFPFAQRVAKVISNRIDPSSIVIGIYGAWGEGKTSVFNFIENELNEEEHVVCIRFNPWRFADENTMLLNFFNELVRAINRELETKAEKVGKVVDQYLKPLAQILGKGENIEAVSDILSSADINEIKCRVEKILEEEKKRIVVLIDDIDRLDKSEIHAVFRMVKLTADFKYTAYILAFDKEMVSASLEERYGASNLQAGRLFLEKIIQVPLQLPAIEKTDLKNFCFKAIDEALKVGEIVLSENEIQQFVNNFQFMEVHIKTPRQAKLYSNIIMFSLPILKGEVNMVDLMLIEGLRIFTPEIYLLIRENKEIFLNGTQLYEDQEERDNIKRIIDDKLIPLNLYDTKAMLEVLIYLFPKLESIYSNVSYGHEEISEWDINQRVCSGKYFQRFFSYSIARGDLSDIKLNNFIDNIESKTLEEINKEFEDFINEKNVGTFINKMRNKVKLIRNSEILKKLARIIVMHGGIYPNPQQLFQFSNTFSQAAMLVTEIVMRQGTTEEKNELAKELINQAQPVQFSTETFRWLRSSKDIEGNVLTEDDIDNLGEELANKISMEISNDISLMFADFSGSLFFWNKYDAYKASETIDKILTLKPEYALNIMKQYLPEGWGNNGLKVETDLERLTYDVLERDVGAEKLILAISKIYKDLPLDEKYPEFIECTYEEKIARQFIWLNNYIKSKE